MIQSCNKNSITCYCAVESNRTLCICLLLCGWQHCYLGYTVRKNPCSMYKGTQNRCECHLMEQVFRIFGHAQYISIAFIFHLHYSMLMHIFFTRLASSTMASGSDDGSFSIWNLRMLKVCIDSEVKDWWLFFFSPLIKGVGGWWCWVAYTHFFLIKVEESSTVLLFMTNMTFLFSFRKMMLLWHISSITSIQLHLLNGVHMNLLHWQFHHRITN